MAAAAAEWARAYAVNGRFTPCPRDMPGSVAVQGVTAHKPIDDVPPDQPVSIRQPPVIPGAVTLSEAVTAGLLGPTIHAARKARSRDEDFPEPVGERGSALLYAIDDLHAWKTRKAKVKVLR